MSFEQSQLAKYLSMAETRVKRSKETETVSKAESGKCLICGKGENNRRGLCVQHYHQFLRAKSSMTKKEGLVFEQEQIHEGRILPVGQLREIRNPNVFKSTKTA